MHRVYEICRSVVYRFGIGHVHWGRRMNNMMLLLGCAQGHHRPDPHLHALFVCRIGAFRRWLMKLLG